jgi:hypothetical protein
MISYMAVPTDFRLKSHHPSQPYQIPAQFLLASAMKGLAINRHCKI